MKKMSVTRKLQFGIAILVLLSSISSLVNFIAYKKVERSYNEFAKLNDVNRELNYFTNLLTNNTLGYMDAIVDKESGDVVSEIVGKHEEFSKWITTNKVMFIEHITYINPNFETDKFFKNITTYWEGGSNMIKDIKNKKS